MRKIFAFVRVSIHVTLAYRTESLVWFLLEFMGLIPLVSLWLYMGDQGRMSMAEVNYLITYYFLAVVVSRLTSSNFEGWVINEIKDGHVATLLLKPFSYTMYLFTQESTWRVINLIYLAPAVLALWLVLGERIVSGLQLVAIFPAALILLISMFQRLWVSWIISIAAFWIDQASSLEHLKWMLEGTLGGSWLPLMFFPLWFQSIAKLTPFYFWYSFPINILTGKVSGGEFWMGVVIHLFWLALLWGAGVLIWKSAVKKFTAVGN